MTLIHAAPRFSLATADGTHAVTFDLQTAINRARPGDVVKLAPGVYRHPVTIGRGGTEGAPIVIQGPDQGEAVFDGARAPQDGVLDKSWPLDSDWAFVKLFDASHVTIENIRFRNCWPSVFYIRGCSDLTLRDMRGEGARYVAFARSSAFRKTRRLLLERIAWVQDPAHDMWNGRVKWREVKTRAGYEDKSWLRGALFQSFDIEGDVVIRNCDVSHAFNGIRMNVRDSRVRHEGGRPVVDGNRNVRIYGNRFSYIRDNAIEPEAGLHGWLVAENHFFQVHAALSCDAVAIRDGAFVANRFLNVSRPDDISNTGGKIIKFLDHQDPKPSPLCFGFVTAFNSVRTRTRYVADAKLKAWLDVNNAVERFEANARDDAVLFSTVIWSALAKADGLATNDADFPHAYRRGGANVHDWPSVTQVFDHADPAPDLNASLGGWDGELRLSAPALALRSVECDLHGPDGRSISVPAGQQTGYRSLKDLGMSDWISAALT